jgi:hypothetical protein
MQARMLMLAAAYRWHKAALHRLHPQQQQSNTATGDMVEKAELGEVRLIPMNVLMAVV